MTQWVHESNLALLQSVARELWNGECKQQGQSWFSMEHPHSCSGLWQSICWALTLRTLSIAIKFSLWKDHTNPNTANIICRVQVFNPQLPKGFGAIAALTHPILDAFLILRKRWCFCPSPEHLLVPLKGAQQPVMPEAAHLAGSMGIISLLWIPGIQWLSKQCHCMAHPLCVPADHWARLDVPRATAPLLSHSLLQLIRDFHLTWTNLTKIFTKS